jgi:hypothetical protein
MINTVTVFLFDLIRLRTKEVYLTYTHGTCMGITFSLVYYFLLVVMQCMTTHVPLWKGTYP